MEDWNAHVLRWEEELRKIDAKIAEANADGQSGRRIYSSQRDHILSMLGNARDLVRGRD
ncbi:hypothetical protein ACSLBF_16815 [Pseudoalteromonas sp. T1lg65]|uniref:hypothetical protein n=1 Tax=Pseudoalteromonas sp. T1lg65 TaxID=2077101 RepID=UPI003F7960CD